MCGTVGLGWYPLVPFWLNEHVESVSKQAGEPELSDRNGCQPSSLVASPCPSENVRKKQKLIVHQNNETVKGPHCYDSLRQRRNDNPTLLLTTKINLVEKATSA